MPRGREVWWHLIISEAFKSRRKILKSDSGETAAVGPVRAKAGATGGTSEPGAPAVTEGLAVALGE